VDAAYFEVFDVSDLAHTLRILGLALAVAGFVTTLLGVAIGLAASGRTLKPLASVSQAAMDIAGGRLDTRLPAEHSDPDLAGLTTSFNRMVDQLQERIERDARFTSDVSHELRSPLTTLSASLEVLEAHRGELSPRARQALDLLADDLSRFQRMVADLLEMSRSDTGSAEVNQEEVEVGELVRRSVAAATRHAPPHAAVPVLAIDPTIDEMRMAVDKRRFERIMANLVENAALYGGGATRVTADPGPLGRGGWPTIRVGVEDRGPGVRREERTKIFDRFYRGQAAGRRGAGNGSGLGLALVSEHARLNGGTVWVEDAPGGGARFVVQLPMVHDQGAW
jgi:signal transduction histidine kinase